MSTHLLKHKATLYTSSACLPLPLSGAGGGGRSGDKDLGPHGGSLGPKRKRVPFGTRLRPEKIRELKAIKVHYGHNLNEVIETALFDAEQSGWSPAQSVGKVQCGVYRAAFATSLDPRVLTFLKALSRANGMAMNVLIELLIQQEFDRLPAPAKYPNFIRPGRRDKTDAAWEQEMIEMFGPGCLDDPDVA